jgi:hypothetical protein
VLAVYGEALSPQFNALRWSTWVNSQRTMWLNARLYAHALAWMALWHMH